MENIKMQKSVILTGSSGFLGRRIQEELLSKGYTVITTKSSHKTPKDSDIPGIIYRHINFLDSEATDPRFWEGLIKEFGSIGIINCAAITSENKEAGLTYNAVNVNPPIAMAEACNNTGAKMIQLSTIPAGYDYGHKFAYPSSKRAVDDAMQDMRGLKHVIIRPDIVYTEKTWGHTFSFDQMAQFWFTPIVGGGDQTLQPVHLEDLVKLVNLLETDKYDGQILNAVGPKTITIKELMKLQKEKRDETFSTIPVSYSLALAFARHYPQGVMNEEFVNILRQQAKTPPPELDHTAFMEAVGLTEMTSLQQAYEGYRKPDKPIAHPFQDTLRYIFQHPARLICVAKTYIQESLHSGTSSESEVPTP